VIIYGIKRLPSQLLAKGVGIVNRKCWNGVTYINLNLIPTIFKTEHCFFLIYVFKLFRGFTITVNIEISVSIRLRGTLRHDDSSQFQNIL